MASKRNSLFSPSAATRHALRRRSLAGSSVSSNGTIGSAVSAGSAPWSRKESALLVQAWRDVVEHPCAALESVDAFQTRLFLRFQEVSGAGGNDDDTVSMAGSECSMESADSSDGYYARATRTQTSVVLKTYALRRMAGFVADFIAKQEKRQKQREMESQESQESQEVEMRDGGDAEVEGENDEAPVNWFALSRNDQIERFQKAGASSYIELDEHMYTTIETILELQEKCKQEAPASQGSASGAAAAANGGSSQSSSNGNAAAAAWSEEEVRHVLDAWRDAHLRTPTKLPGGDSFYARFIARNGENSQRSKPEVADTKLALMNMQRVVSAFHSRTPTNGKKLTRGNLKRQRQNWFALSLTERERAFASEGGHQGCRFLDISEDMYETISELMGASAATGSFSTTLVSPRGDAATHEPSKRRNSIKLEPVRDSGVSRSSKRETIDLLSDDDISFEDGDDEDKQHASGGLLKSSEDEGDVDMDERERGSSSSSGSGSGSTQAAGASTETPAARQGTEEAPHPGDGEHEADHSAGLDESMDFESEELKGSTAHPENSTEDDVALAGAVNRRPSVDGSLELDSRGDLDRICGNALASPFKKQKLEDPEVKAMMAQLEAKAQQLDELMRQVEEERDQERREREKLLQAIQVDQQGRDAVLELLRIEQDERRQDREERRKMLQILLREQQERRKEFETAIGGGRSGGSDTKFKIKDEDL